MVGNIRCGGRLRRLDHPAWPAGVIGIVAGRLAERFGKPAVLISAPPGELAHGSARSVPGCDIHAAIAAQVDMLYRFGGHPMAAGFSTEAERIPEFRAALTRTVEAMTGGVPTRLPLQIDAYLSLSDLSLDLVAQLNRLAPFGPGNPPVCLASCGLRIASVATIGRADEHRKLVVEDEEGNTRVVLWWQGADWPLPEGRFDLAYTARASDYQGRPELELEWLAAREVERPPVVVREAAPAVGIVDHRRTSDPEILLHRLLAGEGIQVWAEGNIPRGVPGLSRDDLVAGETLVIWNAPPGPDEVQAVMKRVLPRRVILFAVDPGLDEPVIFLQRLAGLVRHSLRAREGRVNLSALAAATAQRRATVQAGLRWLEVKGQVRIVADEGDQVTMAAGDGRSSTEVDNWQRRVVALLEETAAYRAHFARADAATLLSVE